MTESGDLIANTAFYEEGTNLEPVFYVGFSALCYKTTKIPQTRPQPLLLYPLLFNIELGSRM